MSDTSLTEQLINAFVDGQLSKAESAKAQKLIDENPQYAQLASDIRSQREQLANLPRFELPDSFADRVLKAAQSNPAAQVSQAVAGKVEPVTTTPFLTGRTAAAAILSLAAMVMLTLFIFPAFMENALPEVASKAIDADVPAAEAMDSMKEDLDVEDDRKKLLESSEAATSLDALDGAGALEDPFAKSKSDLADLPETENKQAPVLKLKKGDPVAERSGMKKGSRAKGVSDDSVSDDMMDSFDSKNGLVEKSAESDEQESQIASAMRKDKLNELIEAEGGRDANLAQKFTNEEQPMFREGPGLQQRPAAEKPNDARQVLATKENLSAESSVAESSPTESSVKQVWLIEMSGSNQLAEIQQALADNMIQVPKVSAPAGNSGGLNMPGYEAVYVVSKESQMRGALSQLAGNQNLSNLAAFDMSQGNTYPQQDLAANSTNSAPNAAPIDREQDLVSSYQAPIANQLNRRMNYSNQAYQQFQGDQRFQGQIAGQPGKGYGGGGGVGGAVIDGGAGQGAAIVDGSAGLGAIGGGSIGGGTVIGNSAGRGAGGRGGAMPAQQIISQQAHLQNQISNWFIDKKEAKSEALERYLLLVRVPTASSDLARDSQMMMDMQVSPAEGEPAAESQIEADSSIDK